MVLEATMIVVDNSESARNGDYPPSRWDSQTDAANLIFHSKTQSNPESSCGLLSMGGSGPEILTTLTTNPGKILDGLHRTKIQGDSHFYTGIMIASLALKHRGNKSQRQRIVVFVCSPVGDSGEKLVRLGKRMKKNNTAVDVVVFGELTDENLGKLQGFHDAVKGGEGSCLEVVSPGSGLLSDSIVASPILAGEGGVGAGANNGEAGGAGAGGGGGSGGGDFEFGVDPNLDPELALVLRMSMEEERERQAREQRARDEAEGKTNLESVPEEGQPLLGGEAEGSAGASGKNEEEGKKEDKKEDEDRMDTA